MAFNWQTFKTRTLTAAVFVVVMLVGLLWNRWSFFVLFSIIHFGCWWEYLKLSEKIHNISLDKFIKYFFCVCGYLIMLSVGFSSYSYDFTITIFNLTMSVKWGLAILFIICLFAFLFQNKKIDVKHKWFILAGFIYISLSLGLMLDLDMSDKTIDIHLHDTMFIIGMSVFPIVIITSIWINDTMAYIIGSLIGKTPLSKVSPRKTWEGTIGGIILCIVVIGFLFPLIFINEILLPISIIIGSIAAVAAIAGTFGDLFESKLKRMANVKDSGTIMPGHGGFLDRFDSMLLAIPAVWLYVYFFMR